MKRTLRSTLVLILLLAGAGISMAREPMEPMAILAVRSYRNALDDIAFMGMTVDNEQFVGDFSKSFNLILKQLAGREGFKLDQLTGIDESKPCGLLVNTDQVNIVMLGFLPVTDLTKALESFAPLIGPAATDEATGLTKIGENDMTWYVKEQDGYAFFAQLPLHLESLPNPVDAVGALLENHDMVAQFNVAKTPEYLRSMIIDLMRRSPDEGGSFISDLIPSAAGGAPGAALANQMAVMRTNLLQRMLLEAESVTLGISLDENEEAMEGHGRAELIIKPVPGSAAASHLASLQHVKTQYGGLVKDSPAAAIINVTGPLDAASTAEFKAQISAYRTTVMDSIANSTDVKSEEEREIFTELASGLIDAVDAGADSGSIDMALRVEQEGRTQYKFVGAVKIADGQKVAEHLARLAELGENDPALGGLKLAPVEHEGISIHTFGLNASPELKPMEKLFGALKMSVAASDDTLWVAMGPNSIEMLKAVMDAGEAEVPPLQVVMRMSQMINVAAPLLTDPNMGMALTLLRFQLVGMADGDLIRTKAIPGDDQLVIETTVGAEVLRIPVALLNVLPMLLQATGGGGGGFPGLGR